MFESKTPGAKKGVTVVMQANDKLASSVKRGSERSAVAERVSLSATPEAAYHCRE
jgi:hypothetical protein